MTAGSRIVGIADAVASKMDTVAISHEKFVYGSLPEEEMTPLA